MDYERDGYVVFPEVIDAGLVEEARAHIDWLLARHPDRRPEKLTHDLVQDDPFWVRLVGDDRLLDVAERFVGPDIALFASHYLASRRATASRCCGTRTRATGRSSPWRW